METQLPGQSTLPGMAEEIGYDSITNLRPPQERFCQEYVLGGSDAKSAYLRAYPAVSEKSAIVNAARLLSSEKVKLRISEIRTELQRRFAVDAQSVVALLALSMGIDRRQFVDHEGKPLAIHELPAEAAAIVDIEIILDRHGKKHAVPMIPERMKAAVELAKIMGITKTTLEVTNKSSLTAGARHSATDAELEAIALGKP